MLSVVYLYIVAIVKHEGALRVPDKNFGNWCFSREGICCHYHSSWIPLRYGARNLPVTIEAELSILAQHHGGTNIKLGLWHGSIRQTMVGRQLSQCLGMPTVYISVRIKHIGPSAMWTCNGFHQWKAAKAIHCIRLRVLMILIMNERSRRMTKTLSPGVGWASEFPRSWAPLLVGANSSIFYERLIMVGLTGFSGHFNGVTGKKNRRNFQDPTLICDFISVTFIKL